MEYQDNAPDTRETEAKNSENELTDKEKSFSRRALLQAGWTAPVILAAAMPLTAQSASPGHGDHSDAPHTDTPHNDAPHTDTPHNDAPHSDTGVDAKTIGFWKNKPERWPITTLVLGNLTYSQAECLAILQSSTIGDASRIMGVQLIAAKLNVANGCSTSIQPTINAADALLAGYSTKIPLNIPTSSSVGQQMVNLGLQMDIYNNSEAESKPTKAGKA